MNNLKRYLPPLALVVVIGLAFLLGKILPILPFALNTWFNCQNFVVNEMPSPDGDFVASILVVSCNNEPPTTFVLLRKSSQPLNLNDRDSAFFGLAKSTAVSIKWVDDSSLVVYYFDGNPGKMLEELNGITITYLPLDSRIQPTD